MKKFFFIPILLCFFLISCEKENENAYERIESLSSYRVLTVFFIDEDNFLFSSGNNLGLYKYQISSNNITQLLDNSSIKSSIFQFRQTGNSLLIYKNFGTKFCYISKDKGTNWQSLKLKSVDFLPDNVVVMKDKFCIYSSNENKLYLLNSNFEIEFEKDISADSVTNIYPYINDELLLRTSNISTNPSLKGTYPTLTFQQADYQENYFMSVHPFNNYLFVRGSQTDGLRRWNKVDNSIIKLTGFAGNDVGHFNNFGNNIYISTEEGLYKSENYGIDWSEEFFRSGEGVTDFSINSKGRIVLITNTEDVYLKK